MNLTINSALLVIDMQKGSFTRETPRFDTIGTVDRINRLAQHFRDKGLPVIFIQHDGSNGGRFLPNTEEWELLDELQIAPDDLVVSKYANDAFYSSDLGTKLNKLNIKELYITGCATDFCVESTIQSALAKDYTIKVVADGHTTGDRPHMQANKVIEHYNWVWQNMIPTKGTIEVIKFDKLK